MRHATVALLLAASLLVPTAVAAAEGCVSNGLDVCERARQFAAWLNHKRSRNGQHFEVTRAQNRGRSIEVHFTYLHGQEGFDRMLAGSGRTRPQFEATLLEISKEGGCKEPARSIVLNGGTFVAIYEFSDGTRIYEHTVDACPAP